MELNDILKRLRSYDGDRLVCKHLDYVIAGGETVRCCPCNGTAFCNGEGVRGCIDALAKWARAERDEGVGDA